MIKPAVRCTVLRSAAHRAIVITNIPGKEAPTARDGSATWSGNPPVDPNPGLQGLKTLRSKA
jgi:hypothetical protein